MVGTPVNSNAQVAATNQKIFNACADSYRKQVDNDRRIQVAKENLSILTTHERFKREYIYRDAPRYWHNPEFDCSDLWEGIELAPVFEHFFTSLIPNIDFTENLDRLQIPIYLAAGLSDFDCCPAHGWGSLGKLPRRFKIEHYSQSGHYPQYEERDLFDSRLIKWLKSL